MSVYSCRACGSSSLSHGYRIQGYDLLRCQQCRSLTTAHSMSVSSAQDFYGAHYFQGGDYRDYQATEEISKRNFARLVERLRQTQPDGRLLEVGCAFGYFLDLAKSHWRVEGMDISAAAISACQERLDCPLYCGDLATWPLQSVHYDWVVGWDMIEHVDNPREYVSRSFDLLRPGGYIALTTGDVHSWAARILGRRWRLLTPPSHLTFFTRQGMRAMLREAGFDQISFETVGYDRSLDFIAFRLLGHDRYSRFVGKHKAVRRALLPLSIYVDLGDIMLVLAQRPA